MLFLGRAIVRVFKSYLKLYTTCVEGGIGAFGFADMANFGFGFSVFALKNCGFSVLVSRAVCGFSPM